MGRDSLKFRLHFSGFMEAVLEACVGGTAYQVLYCADLLRQDKLEQALRELELMRGEWTKKNVTGLIRSILMRIEGLEKGLPGAFDQGGHHPLRRLDKREGKRMGKPLRHCSAGGPEQIKPGIS